MAETVAQRLGGIDILVNNAGINIRKRPEDPSEDEWRTVMDTNGIYRLESHITDCITIIIILA